MNRNSEYTHIQRSGGGRTSATPDNPNLRGGGSPAPPHTPAHFKSACGLPIYRLLNKIPPINKEAGGRLEKWGGVWGAGVPPNVNGGVWRNAGALPQNTVCVYIFGS